MFRKRKYHRKACRICAGNINLVDILDPANQELVNILRVCVNIEVKPNDKKPKQLCERCREGLEETYRLRNLGEATQKKLLEDQIVEFKEEVIDLDDVVEEVIPDSTGIEIEVADEFVEENYSDSAGYDVEVSNLVEVGNEEVANEAKPILDDDPGFDDDFDQFVSNVVEEDYNESPEIEVVIDTLSYDRGVGALEFVVTTEETDVKDVVISTDFSETIAEPQPEPDDKNIKKRRAAPKRMRNGNVKRTKKAAKSHDELDEDDSVCDSKQEPEYDDDAIYHGELEQQQLIEFHKKVCRKPTSWQKLLERVKDGNQRFKCKTCGVRYIKIASFVCHALKHTGEKTYSCRLPDCTNIYSNWRALETHLIFHCDHRKFVCELCGFACKHRNGYYKHKKVHELRELKKNQPGEIKKRKKRGRTTPKLPDVAEDDEEIENYDDDVFFDKENPTIEELLAFHQNQYNNQPKSWPHLTEIIKDGPNKYRCAACGKEYKSRKDHIYHVLKHTGERPMKCKVLDCNTGFRNWKKLKDHLVGHCDARKHVCDICGSSFKFRFVLTRHLERHSTPGERKYKCKFCDATFVRSCDCASHESKHKTIETLTKCDLCDKIFLAGRGRLMQNHMIDEHGVKVVFEKDEEPEEPVEELEYHEGSGEVAYEIVEFDALEENESLDSD